MRKLKFNVDQLVKGRREYFPHIFPHEADVQLIKLTYEEAMTFNEPEVDRKTPIAYYGEDKLLQEGEFYEGYALVAEKQFKIWSMEVVRIKGAYRRISAHEIHHYPYKFRPWEISAGKAWRLECPPDKGDWFYLSVLSFCYCEFGFVAKQCQPGVRCLRGVKPDMFETNLLNKLWKALLSEDKIVTLTKAEEVVLQASLKNLEKDYERIFEQVK